MEPKKYTATEWATMEGGHAITPREEKFSFVKDLNESREYRTRQQVRNHTAREIADHAFIDLMTLWILYNEYAFSVVAIKYAQRTMMYSNFKGYRQNGTDLYMTLHLLSNGSADNLTGSRSDNAFLGKVNFPEVKIKSFLNMMKMNQLTPSVARMTLQDAERKFQITTSGYRSARRLAQDWPKLNETQRALVVTRLLQFYRTHARRSELFGFLKDLARTRKLEIRNANNAEKPRSVTSKTVAAAAALGAGAYAGWQLGKAASDSLLK
jgi:hypothetical protein